MRPRIATRSSRRTMIASAAAPRVAVPPRLLLLAGVFRLGKTPLPLHRPLVPVPRTSRFYPS